MGFDRGLYTIPDDFDAPMPDFEADLYGSSDATDDTVEK